MADLFTTHQSEVTQADCDKYAQSLLKDTCVPVAWQGYWSYTVVSNSGLVVQFRWKEAPLNEKVMQLAKHIFGPWVPKATYHGYMPASSISVWVMEQVHGIGHLFLSQSLTVKTQDATISDLAKFYAASWKNPQCPDYTKLDYYHLKLTSLLEQSPTKSKGLIREILQNLEDITSKLPWVLTHWDLSSANILVDERKGNLAGVIDWAETSIEPFGIALWGIEQVLGYQNSSGWHWYGDDAESVRHRTLFRNTFCQEIGGTLSDEQYKTIEASRKLGIILRYGFIHTMPVMKIDTKVLLLDTFLKRRLF